MSKTLYTARFVLPITAPPIEDGAFLVDNGKIEAVGTRKELTTSLSNVEAVDFGDSIVLPPMTNAHTHLELTHFNEWADEAGDETLHEGFVDWILRLVKVKKTVQIGDVRASLAEGLRLCLQAGTGVIGDILSTLGASGAYQGSPLEGRVFAEMIGHDLDACKLRLDQVETLVSSGLNKHLALGLSPHTPYTLSNETLAAVFGFAEKINLQSCIHLAESEEESVFVRQGAGPIVDHLYSAAGWDPSAAVVDKNGPTSALCKNKLLPSGSLVVHGVHVGDEDIAALKEADCSLVLCPRSNESLGVGKAPLEKYLAAGIKLALGTDSLASAASLSIWDELAFAQDWFGVKLDPRKWLEIATTGGAKALNLDNKGALSAGYDASFQVVTLPQMPSCKSLEEVLCRTGSGVDVTHLYLSAKNVLS